MILYDGKLQLFGITEESLNLLGFSSLGLFLSKFSDINELFIAKRDFLSQDKSEFINFLNDKNVDSKNAILKSENGRLVEILVSKIKFFTTFDPENGIALNLSYLQDLSDDMIVKNAFVPTKIEPSTKRTKVKMPNIFDLEYKRRLEMIAQKEYLELSRPNLIQENLSQDDQTDNTKFSKDWFDITTKELGVSQDDLKFFLGEFLDGQTEHEEQLHEALLLGDTKTVTSITSILKDPASSLNLYPLLVYLDKFENSKNAEASKLFREYKIMLNEIEKYVVQRESL